MINGRNLPSINIATIQKILFFLIILLIPTQLGKHFWPAFSFVYSIPIDYLSPTVYLWDLLMLCLFGIKILRKQPINKTALILCLVFLLSQAISLSNAQSIGASLVRFWQYLIVCLFGLYIVSEKIEFYQLIKWPLQITVIVESLIGVFQVINGRTMGLWFLGERTFTTSTAGIATFDWQGQFFLRAYGTFPHPNVLASFMLICVLILAWLASKPTLLNSITIIIASIVSLLSYSRSVISIFFIYYVFIMRKRFFWLIILFLSFYPLFSTRFGLILDADNITVIRREELARNALVLFNNSPLTGIGLNNFIPISASTTVLSGSSRFFQPVHSIFLLLLSETGIIGLLGFLVFFLYPLILLFRNKSPNRHFILSLYLIVISLGNIDHYFLTVVQGQRILFLIWGLSMLEFSSERNKKSLHPDNLATTR